MRIPLPLLPLLFLPLAACPTDTGDDDDTTVPDLPDCTEDEDCPDWEICEEQACVGGDRNNAFEEARFLEYGDEVFEYVSPPGDVDYYRFFGTAGDTLVISATAEGSAAEDFDTVIRTFNDDGQELGWCDDFERITSGQNATLYTGVPEDGTFFFTVEDTSSFRNDPDRYPLVGGFEYFYQLRLLRITGSDREAEPNDSALTANLFRGDREPPTLAENTNYNLHGFIDEPGDVDWFLVDVPEAVDLRLYVYPHNGSQLSHRLSVYAPSNMEQPVGTFTGLNWETRGDAPTLETGPYLLKVESTRPDEGGAAFFYTVHIAHSGQYQGFRQIVGPEATSREEALELDLQPNGDLESAFVRGVIATPEDADYMSFDAAAGQTVTVAVGTAEFGSSLIASVAILDADGEVIEEGIDTSGDEAVIDSLALDPGLHYVRILAFDEDSDDDEIPGDPSAYYRAGIHLGSE